MMEHEAAVRLRPMDATVGLGLLRGVGCGAASGALAGAGLSIWDGLTPAAPGVYEDPFSMLLMGYVAVIAALVGAVVGLLASAAAMAVLAVGEARGRRRSWMVSVVAAVLAALIALVVLNVFAQKSDGVFLSLAQTLVLGVGAAAVALRQVRAVVRPLR